MKIELGTYYKNLKIILKIDQSLLKRKVLNENNYRKHDMHLILYGNLELFIFCWSEVGPIISFKFHTPFGD